MTTTRTRLALLAGAITLLGLAGLCIGDAEREATSRTPSRPALADLLTHTSVSQPDCHAEPRTAARRAARTARDAAEHWQRYPFAPEVGLQALALQRESAHCYHIAQASAEASAAEAHTDDLLRALERDLHAIELRLHLAVEQQRPGEAARHARHLLAMLPPDDGAYHRWLLALRHSADASR